MRWDRTDEKQRIAELEAAVYSLERAAIAIETGSGWCRNGWPGSGTGCCGTGSSGTRSSGMMNRSC